eukprot:CAMPEP_0203835852 /NCGR_PEP_ID=MMETSP0115-20131106/73867_1 /ASSEMBLY_ACC=CAM_ASM_000227 /TAXON_ID=33651 /ORGANISM="Bicosoecid sp, Strain ms1" /LENGTH=307 /DNA_ID=CAMNT_0050744929 /DNA_START=55 /DNA_END=975 /DNA_ORIENTATION=+
MTERWVSQAKHYCKFCKKWMQDTPMVRRLHEQGRGHTEAVKEATRAARQAKDDERREARELASALRDAEAAAKEAFARDAALLSGQPLPAAAPPGSAADARGSGGGGAFGGGGGGAGVGAGGGAPGAGAHGGGFARGRDDAPRDGWRGVAGEPGKPPPPPPPTTHVLGGKEERAGEYRVRGVLYLQGDFHADKLVAGTPCEALQTVVGADGEEDEEWLPATVASVRQMLIPNTTIVQRSYTVRFLPSEDAPAHLVGTAAPATPDKIRIRVTPPPARVDAAAVAAQEAQAAAAAAADGETGPHIGPGR